MKRWLWVITLGLIAGVALASFISRDPGYALLQVAGYRLETSVVALVLVAVGLFIFIRMVGRLVRIIMGVVPGFGRWLGKRRDAQNVMLLKASLDDLLAENVDGLANKITQLERSQWHSVTRAAALREWLLLRQLRDSKKVNHVKKLWGGYTTARKPSPSLQVQFVTRLYELGAFAEVDAALLEIAEASWPDALNGVLGVHHPKNAEQLMDRLGELKVHGDRPAAEVGLVMLEAWGVDGEAGDEILAEAYRTQTSIYLLQALGTRRMLLAPKTG